MSVEDNEVWLAVLYSVLSVLVLFSNSVVIIVIIKSPELRHPTLWNIAVMAAWDFALGIFIIIVIMPSKILNAFAYPESYGRFSSILMSFMVAQNSFNIMVALVDRYISICMPLHYPRLMSAKRFTLAYIIVLSINLVRFIILLATEDAGSYNKSLGFYTHEKPSVFRSLTSVLMLTITLIIVGLLIKIRFELSKKATNAGNSQAVSTQFTNTMCISNLMFILCYIPTTFGLLISYISEKDSVLVKQIGFLFIASNSLWNVFIYAATYKPFRDAFLKVFCSSYFRERARRELGMQFQRNKVSVFTVE